MNDIFQKNISANQLNPSSNPQILIELMTENSKYQGMLGPTKPPEGGWHDKILAVSDGSLKSNYGTAGFIAETSSKSFVGGIKISPPTHGIMSSYRSEGGGLLLMLLTLYLEKGKNHLYAWCDNQSLVDKFNEIDISKPHQLFGSSLDIMDMLQWCKSLWGNKLTLQWHRGHPEERDPSGESWSKVDWLNYSADAVAEKEYNKSNGLELSSLLFERREISLCVNNIRLEDVHRKSIQNLLGDKHFENLCAIYNINPSNICLRLTEIASGKSSMEQRISQLKFQWEQQPTNGWKAETGQLGERVGRSHGDSFEKRAYPITESRCRLCCQSQVETIDHLLTSCPHFKDIRKKWFNNEISRIKEEEPQFEQTFRDSIQLSNQIVLTSKISDINIHDVMKLRIPKRWSRPMKKSKYPVSDEYIRNFGKRVKSNLWDKIWKARLPAVKEWEKEEEVDYRMFTGLDYSTLEGVT